MLGLFFVSWLITELRPAPASRSSASSPQQPIEPAPPPDPVLAELKGEHWAQFGKYKYNYAAEGGKLAIVYEPPLPADADVITAAVHNVVQIIFKKDISKVPAHVAKLGTALFGFATLDEIFYALPVKNERKAVTGIGLYREMQSPGTLHLNAEANVAGVELVVKNLGPADWSKVKLELNGGLLSGRLYVRPRLTTVGQRVRHRRGKSRDVRRQTI